MARFSFIIPPYLGHIHPTLSVGAILLEKGHEVFWFSIVEFPSEFFPKGGKQVLLKQKEQPQIASEQAKDPFGMLSLVDLYEKVLVPMNKMMFECLDTIIETYKPDVIINDQQAFSGAFIASKYGIPYATFVTAPAAIIPSPHFPKVIEWEQEQVVTLQKSLGIHKERSLACSEDVTTVFSTADFMGMSFPKHYKLVGPALHFRPSLTSFDWDRLKHSKKKKVLISIGSILKGERSFFEKIIEAFQDFDALFIVVTDPHLFKEWPDNFIVQSYVPQIELLQYMDAVISHSGHNTVCESIYYEVPLLVIPVAFDQSLVATQVVNSGCGIRLKYKRLSGNAFAKALYAILNEEKYKTSVHKISQSFKKGGGAARAAQELESLFYRSTEINHQNKTA